MTFPLGLMLALSATFASVLFVFVNAAPPGGREGQLTGQGHSALTDAALVSVGLPESWF